MSYDIDLVLDLAEADGGRTILASWDPTYNLAAMFAEVRAWGGEGVHHLDGMAAQEAAEALLAAAEELEGDPVRFRAHDAPNGWGTYDGDPGYSVAEYIRRFRRACLLAHPDARVRV